MCWRCAAFILVLASILQFGKSQQGCSNIPNSRRFDCYPEGDADEQKCLNRGCCWSKPSLPAADHDGEAPLNIPYCFYPTDYGYQLKNKQKTQTGYLLSLAKQGHAGPYGKDIENLAVDLRFEARDRLHFKVKAVTC